MLQYVRKSFSEAATWLWLNPVLPLNIIKIKISKQNSFPSLLSDVMLTSVSFSFPHERHCRKRESLKWQSVGVTERYLPGSSLRLFNLLYCKYLIPPRCLLAISGHINRRGGRQKGQNVCLRLSDMPLPASSSHLDMAGLTLEAMRTNLIGAKNVFLSVSRKYRMRMCLSNVQLCLTWPKNQNFHINWLNSEAKRLTYLFKYFKMHTLTCTRTEIVPKPW